MMTQFYKAISACALALCFAGGAIAAPPEGGSGAGLAEQMWAQELAREAFARVAGGNGAGAAEGVWQITGTPESGSGIDPFVNIATIAADGTITNADPFLGVGVGKAVRIRGREYRLTFYTLTSALTGFPARLAIYGTGTLDPRGTLSGTFRAELTSADGSTPLGVSYTGTVQGQRLPVEGG